MNKIFLSIDFEDFSHDLGRDLGLWKTRPLRVNELTRAYDAIEAFLAAHGGARATFFCTGIIAERAPELIDRIASDGHEIACHYHFHDEIDRETPESFEANLETALRALRTASGQPVLGFRAPKFRIPQDAPEHYDRLARHVAYDSSYLCGARAAARAFHAQIAGDLALLPIFTDGRLRLGGTYLKLFPAAVARRLIAKADSAGMVPHIYLHPYEFIADGSFVLGAEELAPLGPAKALYWRARQVQWHSAGNRGLPRKLSGLVRNRALGGRLDENLALLSV